MRLLNLFENQEDVWYHGTPDMRYLEKFEGRSLSVSYITDPEKWEQTQEQMQEVEWQSKEYFDLLDQAGKLKQYKTVRAPIFLTNNYGVARTYADDKRSIDYQNAEPGVAKVKVKPGKTLTISGRGQNFRGIEINSVIRGLMQAGVSEEAAKKELAHFSHVIRGDGNKISTDSLVAIVDDLGFDIVDVLGIKDSYMGGGPPATVRMVMNADHVEIIRD